MPLRRPVQVVVTDDLVHRLGRRSAKGMLHELGHTTNRHVEASPLRSSLIGLGGLLLVGDVSYLSLAAVSLSLLC